MRASERGRPARPPAGDSIGGDDLAFLDAVAQAELVKRGEVSPRELVEAAIARIERVNPTINAVVTPLYEKARREAAAPGLDTLPLGGVPYLLKDHFSPSAGDPMYEGMRFLRDAAYVAPEDSHLVRSYREGGLVLVGKTNLPELAITITTEPAAYGPCRNPWDLGRSVGGSSGGSAAAVAAGLVPIAHGTDAGGSIRVPASMCGIVGLKPSRGRVSAGPDHGNVWGAGWWHVHALTRSVRDTAIVLDLVAGYVPGDPFTAGAPATPFAREVDTDPGRLRVGFMARNPKGFPELHEDCRRAVLDTARLLEELGHDVEEAHPPSLDEAVGSFDLFIEVLGSGVAWELERWGRRVGRRVGRGDVEPYTWAFAERSCTKGERFLEGLDAMNTGARLFASWWSDHDLLLTPTIGVPPFELGLLDAPPDNPLASLEKAIGLSPFCGSYNTSGLPAISLPLHWNQEGLPIGVQLGAAYGREDLLLRVAAQLERAQPWAHRRPPVHG